MHVGIFGTTECGKSTLLRYLIRQFLAMGIKTLVWDPLRDPQYKKTGADVVTPDVAELLSAMRRNPGAAVFLDEAGDEKGNETFDHIARKYRHGGFALHFASQRFKDLTPTVRNCLGAVFAFPLSEIDAAELARDFRCKDLKAAAEELKAGDFIYKTRFGDPQKSSVKALFGKV
jgi:hypothetical protein